MGEKLNRLSPARSSSSVDPSFDTFNFQSSSQANEPVSRKWLLRQERQKNWMFMDREALGDGRALREMLNVESNPSGEKQDTKGSVELRLEEADRKSNSRTNATSQLDRSETPSADQPPGTFGWGESPEMQGGTTVAAPGQSSSRFGEAKTFVILNPGAVAPTPGLNFDAHVKMMQERAASFRQFLDSPMMSANPLSGPADPINAGIDGTKRELNPVVPNLGGARTPANPGMSVTGPLSDLPSLPTPQIPSALDSINARATAPSSLAPVIAPPTVAPQVPVRGGFLAFPKKPI